MENWVKIGKFGEFYHGKLEKHGKCWWDFTMENWKKMGNFGGILPWKIGKKWEILVGFYHGKLEKIGNMFGFFVGCLKTYGKMGNFRILPWKMRELKYFTMEINDFISNLNIPGLECIPNIATGTSWCLYDL